MNRPADLAAFDAARESIGVCLRCGFDGCADTYNFCPSCGCGYGQPTEDELEHAEAKMKRYGMGTPLPQAKRTSLRESLPLPE